MTTVLFHRKVEIRFHNPLYVFHLFTRIVIKALYNEVPSLLRTHLFKLIENTGLHMAMEGVRKYRDIFSPMLKIYFLIHYGFEFLREKVVLLQKTTHL